jgi:hypothetical protein
MKIWYAIPTANIKRAEQCFRAWKEKGFRTAAFIDTGASIPKYVDLCISDSYPGYFAAANHLVSKIDSVDCFADIIVTGGDDVFPDPNFTAVDLGKQFYDHFPDGFGVMQPIGDSMPGTEKICGSPWFGRGWLDRAYEGNGPFFSGYLSFFGDEELKLVADSLGALWQRKDVTQFHNHWTRSGGPRMEQYQIDNQKNWQRDESLFLEREDAEWPGAWPYKIEKESIREIKNSKSYRKRVTTPIVANQKVVLKESGSCHEIRHSNLFPHRSSNEIP